MDWIIPGTVRSIARADAAHMEDILNSMYLAGDLALRQVSELTGLEPYAIQNWVKRGFLSPPRHKRYDRDQLCRILIINMLKGAMPLEQVCKLLTYINGALADTSDDMIPDAELYCIFARLAARIGQVGRPEETERWLNEALAEYREPVAGARERVKRVLQIMLTAWAAAQLRQYARELAEKLE